MPIQSIEADLNALVDDINAIRGEIIALHQENNRQANQLDDILAEVAELSKEMGVETELPPALNAKQRQFDLIQEATMVLPADVRQKLNQDYMESVPQVPAFDQLDWCVVFLVGTSAVLADFCLVGMPDKSILNDYLKAEKEQRLAMMRDLLKEKYVSSQEGMAKLGLVNRFLNRRLSQKSQNEDDENTSHPMLSLATMSEMVELVQEAFDVILMVRGIIESGDALALAEATEHAVPEELSKVAAWLEKILDKSARVLGVETQAEVLSILASRVTGEKIDIDQEDLDKVIESAKQFYNQALNALEFFGEASIPAVIEIVITLYAWARETQNPTELEGQFWGTATKLNLVSPKQAKRQALSAAAHGLATLGNAGKVGVAGLQGNLYYAVATINPVQWQLFTTQAVQQVMYMARNTTNLEQVLLNRERLEQTQQQLLPEVSQLMYTADLDNIAAVQLGSS
jgi:hypothetical protein